MNVCSLAYHDEFHKGRGRFPVGTFAHHGGLGGLMQRYGIKTYGKAHEHHCYTVGPLY